MREGPYVLAKDFLMTTQPTFVPKNLELLDAEPELERDNSAFSWNPTNLVIIEMFIRILSKR